MFTFPRITRRRRRPDVGPLLRVPAFAHGDPGRLAELARHTDILRLPPGRTLVRAGATARELIVLLAGEAAVLRADGTRAVLRPGAQIGGCELLGRERHAATVVATSALEVVVVNGPAVRWALAEGIAELAPPASLSASRPGASPSPRRDPKPTVRLAS
ncbi:MAG TPA: cyclic nucleotide-binding domain-containing protein [Acidimicrobiales bacterium]|nr:cyclic nucleotide-binding domain-containing protein [Acidimicrobiales bacterium]